MSELGERCMHQGRDDGPHVLFKEQWEKCMKCTYDPTNNKLCPGYVPTCDYIGSGFYNPNLDISKLSIV